MNEKNLNIYFIGDNKSIEDKHIKKCDIDYCYNYLKNKKVVSLDIETTRKFNGIYRNEGLDPYVSEIVMLQIGDEDVQFVIDYRSVKIDKILPILSSKDIVKVGHNIKFEYKHILHNKGVKLNNVYDTMIIEKIIYKGYMLPNSLKDLNKRYLDIDVDKSTRLEFLNIKNREFSDRQIYYGAEDILYPLLIRNKQLERIESENLEKTISLEMLFLLVLGDMEYKGLYFDKEQWLRVYDKNLIKFNEFKKNLDNYIIDNYFDTDFVSKQLDLFNTGNFTCRISWTSSKQVIEFFSFLGICPKEVSKSTGKLDYTVNAKVVKSSLNTINKDISNTLKDLLSLYLEFKEIEQSVTTFGKKFLKYINPITQRLHSNYDQVLNTGRISSSGPKKLGAIRVIL